MKEKVYRELVELKGLMRQNKFTYEDLGKSIGLSTRCICERLNGTALFNCNEIKKVNDILNIPKSKIPLYFF